MTDSSFVIIEVKNGYIWGGGFVNSTESIAKLFPGLENFYMHVIFFSVSFGFKGLMKCNKLAFLLTWLDLPIAIPYLTITWDLFMVTGLFSSKITNILVITYHTFLVIHVHVNCKDEY